jgi:hypothetical protein
VQGREEDWQLIMDKGWLAGHWILGRGVGTFIPTEYTWLDNNWLQTLMGGGIVGIIALCRYTCAHLDGGPGLSA